MHYLPLPRSVVPAVIVATGMLVIWVGWGTIQDPETWWAPGDLSVAHAKVARCASCHEPFRGPVPTKCVLCHSEPYFEMGSMHAAAWHRDLIRRQQTCLACHTEHRGLRADITSRALINPHGDFVFAVTGGGSCAACHEFGRVFGVRPRLLDNESVRRLMTKGGGAHRPGRMAHCLACHGVEYDK